MECGLGKEDWHGRMKARMRRWGMEENMYIGPRMCVINTICNARSASFSKLPTLAGVESEALFLYSWLFHFLLWKCFLLPSGSSASIAEMHMRLSAESRPDVSCRDQQGQR